MEYRFIIEDQTGTFADNSLESGSKNIFGSGSNMEAILPQTNSNSKTFSDGMMRKAQSTLMSQMILSPLNQATGGLASPVYNVGKSVFKGAGAGAIGGAVTMAAIQGLQLAINTIKQRMTKLENEANKLGDRDNILLRTGGVESATYYTSNFWGIKKTDGRA